MTLPTGEIRYYDGLVLQPDGTYMGLKIKSGSATLSPQQAAFDAAVDAGQAATGVLNGVVIQVTSTHLQPVSHAEVEEYYADEG